MVSAQLRRMRFAVLGAQEKWTRRWRAGANIPGLQGDLTQRRHDRSTHSVPIAEMGNFHEV
eukprot:756215-Hanusia_phi.AAC.1